MSKSLVVLIVEDSEQDAVLLLSRLRREGFAPDFKIVATRDELEKALNEQSWQIIISDLILPQFNGLETIQLLREKELDIPCIIVSGKIGEDTAVDAMRMGARDYIAKDNLSRLGPAIERELQEAVLRRKRREVEENLQESHAFNAVLLDCSPLPMVAVNPDTSIRYVNKAAEKLTGFSAAELVGSAAPYKFWPREQYSHYMQEMAGNGFSKVSVEQKLFRTKRGIEFWVEMTLIPFRVKGELEYILSTWVNLTEEKRLRRELELFNHKIIQAQEEERKRITRELHEDVFQLLSIIKMELEACSRSTEIKSPETLEKLEALQANADHAMQDIRRFSYALRPGDLDYLGLDSALERLAEDITQEEGLQVSFQTAGVSRRLGNDVELVFFRIAQEAANNIVKHAQAAEAKIKMEYYRQKIRLLIQDNGRGFDTAKQSNSAAENSQLGLIGMRERAHLINADLTITSEPGRGTAVLVDLKR